MISGLKGRAAIAAFAVFSLTACQTDEMVRSVNPMLQGEESRVLRQAFSGATLVHPSRAVSHALCPGDTTARRSEVVFSPAGTYEAFMICETPRGDADPIAIFDGSWNIRGNEYCENTFRIMGQPASEANRAVRCHEASVSGDLLRYGTGTYRRVAENRYLRIN